jgi:hypothetical protein
MFDRKTTLAVSALVLLMLAGAIWLAGHMQRLPFIGFIPPAGVMFVAGVYQWRLARAEGDLAPWRKLSGFVVISYTAICTVLELFMVMKVSNVTALPTFFAPARLILAFLGVLFLVVGNWIAKLPPVRMRQPAGRSLDMAGEAAMLRFKGWLVVAYGLVLFVSALLIPISLFVPLLGSTTLALYVVLFIRRRQLKAQLR